MILQLGFNGRLQLKQLAVAKASIYVTSYDGVGLRILLCPWHVQPGPGLVEQVLVPYFLRASLRLKHKI